MIISCNTIVNRRDHVQYLTVSKSYSNNCTCSLTEQNTTLKKSVLWSDTNVKQNMILKIAIRFCYEGCSSVTASSFITFVTFVLRQNVIPY